MISCTVYFPVAHVVFRSHIPTGVSHVKCTSQTVGCYLSGDILFWSSDVLALCLPWDQTGELIQRAFRRCVLLLKRHLNISMVTKTLLLAKRLLKCGTCWGNTDILLQNQPMRYDHFHLTDSYRSAFGGNLLSWLLS